ncbi:MAG: hypothetical protein R2759_09475 [Bacteroidales bacterium]
MNNKETGSYYTPQYLADFISKRVNDFFVDRKRLSVLEPSVGDSSFITSIDRTFNKLVALTALDINSIELDKAKAKWNRKRSVFESIDF